MKTEDTHAYDNAANHLQIIVDLIDAVDAADGDDARDRAVEVIQEHPLCVEVRSPWHTVGAESGEPAEFKILLSTGGPACQIRGELNQYGEPETARVEYQDWGMPWAEFPCGDGSEKLLRYCRTFYFSE